VLFLGQLDNNFIQIILEELRSRGTGRKDCFRFGCSIFEF